MADTPQKVEVVAELNDTQVVRSAKNAASALGEVIAQVAKLEKMTDQLFSGGGSLTKKLEGIVTSIQSMQTLAGQVNSGQIARVSKQISSGGVSSSLQNSGLQGVIANIRTDPALQLQKIEQETNKVLSARTEIFRRIRTAMPDSASAMQVTNAYRQALTALGDAPSKSDPARQAWMQKTLLETRNFQAQISEITLAERIKNDRALAEVEAVGFNRRERAAVIAETKIAKAGAAAAKLEAQARARDPSTAEGEAKLAAAYQSNKNFQGYKGGAPLLQSRLGFMRDFAATGAVLGGAGYAAKSTVDLEVSLKDLQAISKATDQELASLQNTIFEVGQKTKFSTSEIAEGAKVMAQAGYSAQQMATALPAISELATGAGASMEEAVNIVTSVLSIFDMSIERTSGVSNMLAQALNGSKLNLQQLSLGMQYAGNIAADGGIQFEELTAALGAMATAGIKSGSTLGTGLRSLIEELENPSKKFLEWLGTAGLSVEDVDVRTQGLSGALQALADKSFSSATAMNVFEIRAASAYSALSSNVDVMKDLQASLYGTDAATAAAAVQMDTLAAQTSRFGNAITQFTTVAGAPFMDVMKEFIGGAATLLTHLNFLAPAIQTLLTLLLSIVAVSTTKWLLGLLAGFTGLSPAIVAFNSSLALTAAMGGGVSISLGSLTVAMRAFTMSLLSNPVTVWAVGLTAVVGALYAMANATAAAKAEVDGYVTKANNAAAETQKYGDRTKELDSYITLLVARSSSLSNNVQLSSQAAETAAQKFGSWGMVIDQNNNQVGNLINSLIKLRAQQAAFALEKAKTERTELINANQADVANNPVLKRGSSLASTIINQADMGNKSIDANTARLVKQYMYQSETNALDPGELAAMVQGLNKAAANNPRDFITNSNIKKFIDVVNSSDAATVRDRARQVEAKDRDVIAPLAVQSASTGINQAAASQLLAFKNKMAAAAQIKDPSDKVAAIAAAHREAIAAYPQFQAQINGYTTEMLKDPSIQSAYAARAQAAGGKATAQSVLQEDLFQSNPLLGNVALNGRASVITSLPVMEESKKTLDLQIAAIKRQKKPIPQDMLDQQKKLSADIISMKNVGGDAISTQEMIDQNAAGLDAKNTPGVSGNGAANSRERATAKTAERDAKAKQVQIEEMAANGGEEVQGPLTKLLAEWQAAKELAIKSDPNASAQDIADRLEDFRTTEAPKYIYEILNGNIAAAKKLMSEAADKAAADAEIIVGAKLRSGGDLTTGIEDLTEKYNDALSAALAASDADFEAKIKGSAMSPEAIAKRAQIASDYADKTIQATLAAIDASLEADVVKQNREAAKAQYGIDRERGQIGSMDNPQNRGIGDVHKAQGAKRNEQLDISQANLNVTLAQNAYNNATRKSSEIQGRYNAETDKVKKAGISDELQKANISVEEMALNLKKAQDALEGLTVATPEFATAGEAMSAAWKNFADVVMNSKGPFEELADGMAGIFENSKASFGGMLKDVLSGTKSMGDAFKDFTMGILDSLLDLATKIIAQQILTWLIKTVMGFGMADAGMTGAGGEANVPGASYMAALGGDVNNMAGGGEVTGGIPFRDSKLIRAMPGEVMMSRSAVDLAGKDNLLALNARGNSRLSKMPSMPEQQRQDPTPINVWAVLPQHQPQPGKRDFVIAIADDIATGGQTKQLIKAVLAGAI